MALERKPAPEGEPKPNYPESEEYASDRRAFLVMLGGAAAAGLGLYAVGSPSQPVHPQIPAPSAMPAIQTPVVPGGAAPPPQPPAYPQAQIEGDMAVAQPVQPQPPAQPLAAVRGEAAVPMPAQPQAMPLGEAPAVQVQPPAQPQAVAPGGMPAPPPAVPRAMIKGKVAAPEMVRPPKPAPGATVEDL
ncbi:MAG: hypothetical protein M5U26_04575 [Planctomycetota bacterium]|nr:hypothetical protein [Planctomycetota bacterium]